MQQEGNNQTMSSMRNTGNNRIGPNSGKLTTYSRNDNGTRNKIVTDRANNRTDVYSNRLGKKPDGQGHGHEWKNSRDGQSGKRDPK